LSKKYIVKKIYCQKNILSKKYIVKKIYLFFELKVYIFINGVSPV